MQAAKCKPPQDQRMAAGCIIRSIQDLEIPDRAACCGCGPINRREGWGPPPERTDARGLRRARRIKRYEAIPASS
jgi:hypothetical protein